MLQFATIAVGSGSPLACARCGERALPGYFSMAELAGQIKGAAAASTAPSGPNLALVGPEPFAHFELPDLVAACISEGARRIALETDGGALSAGGNADGVLRAGVLHLWIRMLAADMPLADELSGKRGLDDAARTGIATYLAAAEERRLTVSVTAHVPVCAHNLEAVPATVAALAARGVHAVRLLGGNALPSGAEAIIAAACDTGMVNQLWVETDGTLPLPGTHRLHTVVSP